MDGLQAVVFEQDHPEEAPVVFPNSSMAWETFFNLRTEGCSVWIWREDLVYVVQLQ